MPKQHGTRRWLLGSLVGLVPAVAALGGGHGAWAAPVSTKPRPDYGSMEAFRLECELLGGTFTVNGLVTTCYLSDYALVVCDTNGNNCWSTTGRPQPGGGANAYDGSVEQMAPDDQEQKGTGNRKQGKRRKRNRRGGKRRR